MPIVLIIILLTGCTTEHTQLDQVLLLRERVLNSSECTFVANITADYGDCTNAFKLACSSDISGNITFKVLEPESIEGITGTVGSGGGNLTFDNKVLAFPALTEGELSPVSAPMIFMQGLRSGYIRTAGVKGDSVTVIIDDSYQGESLQLELSINQNHEPLNCQIMWQGVRILTVEIDNFRTL